MISMADWQDFGTVKVQDYYVLLKKSTLREQEKCREAYRLKQAK